MSFHFKVYTERYNFFLGLTFRLGVNYFEM